MLHPPLRPWAGGCGFKWLVHYALQNHVVSLECLRLNQVEIKSVKLWALNLDTRVLNVNTYANSIIESLFALMKFMEVLY